MKQKRIRNRKAWRIFALTSTDVPYLSVNLYNLSWHNSVSSRWMLKVSEDNNWLWCPPASLCKIYHIVAGLKTSRCEPTGSKCIWKRRFSFHVSKSLEDKQLSRLMCLLHPILNRANLNIAAECKLYISVITGINLLRPSDLQDLQINRSTYCVVDMYLIGIIRHRAYKQNIGWALCWGGWLKVISTACLLLKQQPKSEIQGYNHNENINLIHVFEDIYWNHCFRRLCDGNQRNPMWYKEEGKHLWRRKPSKPPFCTILSQACFAKCRQKIIADLFFFGGGALDFTLHFRFVLLLQLKVASHLINFFPFAEFIVASKSWATYSYVHNRHILLGLCSALQQSKHSVWNIFIF